MENRIFNISFISKEGNKVSLSINSSWLIYTANAADFKKVIKEYFMPALNYAACDGNEKEIDKINDYIDFMRECLETMQKADKTNKSISAKLKALETVKTGKKASKKTDFEKAANMLLKASKKHSANSKLHNAFTVSDNCVYVTDSMMIIRSDDKSNYTGYIDNNVMTQDTINNLYSFDEKNDYIEISLPSFETIKKAMPKKGNAYIVLNHNAYKLEYIYIAMLSMSPGKNDTFNVIMNESKPLNPIQIYKDYNGNKNNALVMPYKVYNGYTSLFKAVNDNDNVIITADTNNAVIGIVPFETGKQAIKEDPKTENNSAAIIPGKEETTKTKNNNSVVMEYIKKHVVIPITLETIEKDENYKQMVHILNDTDTITGFIKVYRYNYDNLYNNPDIEKQNNAYMYAAESFMKKYPHMHITVSEQMKDMIVSDRELIAYGMTLKMYSFDLDKYGYCLENPIIKIQGIELYKNDIENAINNKRYLIKGHCVYMIMRTKTGYKAHRIYKSNDAVPLLKKNCYSLWDRESTEKLINRAIIPYPA